MSAAWSVHLTEDQSLAYVLGALDEGARADAATHVARCPACATAVAGREREQTALFDLLRAAADRRPPGRATEWSAVRDAVVAPRRDFASAWRWAAGTIGGVSAPFLFAVGVASAAGVGYAALPPVRHAVDRAFGFTTGTPIPTPSPTPAPAIIVPAPWTATPTPLPSPTVSVEPGAPPADDAYRDDARDSSTAATSPTQTAAPPATPSPMTLDVPTGTATSATDESALGGGIPAGMTAEPTAPGPAPTEVEPAQATPGAPPTPDRAGRGGRGGPGGRPPFPPPPGGHPGPGPGPGPGPRPTMSGGPPPDSTPSAGQTPPRRERGPGRGGNVRPPEGTRGERTPVPEQP